ncbi:hypothetical protein OG705_29300 [Streptomyces sp. NBC_00838]|uniref:hypothetical protein n=1 Tax=Streptomyces sp. NBC_00838 TaxID=2903680 RepID=UPI00386B6AB8|nr:hypothetical protein OG705_29300 [Streptomyces sp. NBC_00838]
MFQTTRPVHTVEGGDKLWSVADGEAQVRDHYGTKHSTLGVSRMHRHATGWRLVEPGELTYGAPKAPSDETRGSR